MASPLNRSHAVVAAVAVAVGAIGGVVGARLFAPAPETPPSVAAPATSSVCPPPGAEEPCPEPESTLSITPAVVTSDAGVRRGVSRRPQAEKSLRNPYADPLGGRR